MPAFDQALGQHIDAFVESQRQASGIPGIALAVVNADGAVHLRGFGHDGRGVAIGADTPFPIGSMAAYVQMLLAGGVGPGGRLLSSEGLAQLLAPAAAPAQTRLLSADFQFRYGEGWFVGPFGAASDARWHLGNLASFAAWVELLPRFRRGCGGLVGRAHAPHALVGGPAAVGRRRRICLADDGLERPDPGCLRARFRTGPGRDDGLVVPAGRVARGGVGTTRGLKQGAVMGLSAGTVLQDLHRRVLCVNSN